MPMTPETIPFEEALARTGPLDAALRAQGESELFTFLSAPSAALYRSATDLSHFDRELRRTAAAIERPAGRDEARPVALSTGRLEVVDAAAGSLEVLVLGIGVVQHVLLSDPIRALLTAATITGHARKLVAWIRRPRHDDPLSKITLRTAIETIRGIGELDEARRRLGDPSIELVVAPPTGSEGRTADGAGGGSAGGAPGLRRIAQVRLAPDGTLTLIVIDEVLAAGS
jgi:hypothetical protein